MLHCLLRRIDEKSMRFWNMASLAAMYAERESKEMTKQERATYIAQQMRTASASEQRAWAYVTMLNDTRNDEQFLSMLLTEYLDAQQELAGSLDDEWHEWDSRNAKVYGLVLEQMSIDLTSIKKSDDGKRLSYNCIESQQS